MKTLAIHYFKVDRSVAEVVSNLEQQGVRVLFADEFVGHYIADANYHPVVVRFRESPKAKRHCLAFIGRDQMENYILYGAVEWEEYLLPVAHCALHSEMVEWFDGEFAVAVIQN